MRVVIDTNVFISGLFFGGFPGKILDAWGREIIQPVVSPQILEEYRGTVQRLSHKYPRINIDRFIELISMNIEIVKDPRKGKPITRDADDDKFIQVAVQSKVEYIISGDAHLHEVSPYKGVEVITPKSYYEKYLNS